MNNTNSTNNRKAISLEEIFFFSNQPTNQPKNMNTLANLLKSLLIVASLGMVIEYCLIIAEHDRQVITSHHSKN